MGGDRAELAQASLESAHAKCGLELHKLRVKAEITKVIISPTALPNKIAAPPPNLTLLPSNSRLAENTR